MYLITIDSIRVSQHHNQGNKHWGVLRVTTETLTDRYSLDAKLQPQHHLSSVKNRRTRDSRVSNTGKCGQFHSPVHSCLQPDWNGVQLISLITTTVKFQY